MTEKIRRNLEELSKAAQQNRPKVEKRLEELGLKPIPGFVESASRYYDALKKLASE